MEAVVTGAAANACSEAAKGIFKEVKRHIRYVIIYKQNVEKFEEKLKMLMAKRESVRQEVEAAQRNVEKIKPDVELWCNKVDKVINEEERKVKDLEDKAKNKCFIGLCPNIKSRHQLSRKAEEDATAFDDLIGQCQFNEVGCHDVLEARVAAPSKDFGAFESRQKVFNDLMEALKDPNLKTIGVSGMPGVGKTMLVKEVARKAQEDYLFDEVVMATVSHNPNIRNIQGEIADVLGLKFEEESESGRAMRLRQRFQLRNDKEILVILDDIWGRLDLEAIGISFEDEKKIASNDEEDYIMQNKVKLRSKILLTSRSQAVLHLMNAQRHFQVDVLSRGEAMDLFTKIVGETVDKPDYEGVAVEVVAKCAGLPVAISVIGSALKINMSLDTWNHALQQLERSNPKNIEGMEEGVNSLIKLSYKLLKNKEAQLLFQLCALHPQGSDINVSYLQRYSWGMELLKDSYTLEDARKSVKTAIDKLKASSLLLSSDNDGLVKMHDIIRDVSISIAFEENEMLVIREEVQMKALLKRGQLNNCTAISLPYGDFNELPDVLDCPKLNLLLLFNKDNPLSVPDTFFSKISELKVLHFAGMHFPSLPSSFHSLIKLRTLCLLTCKLGDIAIIGQLTNLDILSFAGSEIEQLPTEIGQLTQLRSLDLRNCSKLKVIPANIISSLSCLEELYMGNSFDRWDVEGNASLTEFKSLHYLTALHIHIRDSTIIPRDFFSEKLERYMIFIGDTWDWSGKYEHLRTLKLKLNKSVDLNQGIKIVLKKSEALYLDQLKGVINVISHEFECGRDFPHLKKLHVQNDPDVEYIINESGVADKIEFSQLRSITLQDLPKLISFCFEEERHSVSRQGQVDSKFISLPLFSEKVVFSCLENMQLSSINVERIWPNQLPNISNYIQNLTSLIIEGCGNLKHLLSSSIAGNLVHLKCFEIVECKCLREIIFTEDVAEENMVIISFPQLNSLKIKNLQHLMGFCSEYYKIEFPTLKTLEIEHCPKLQGFICKSTIEENQHFSLEALFDDKVEFPSLEKMTISHLINMKKIWHNQLYVDSFRKLEEIEVEHCDNLLTIFPLNALATFQRVQTLVVRNCGSLEDIIELQSINMEGTQVVAAQLKELYIFNLPKLKHIWNKDPQGILRFPNLSAVDVRKCWSLKNVFPASVARVLPQLKDLTIGHCGVEEIVSEEEGLEGPITFEFDRLSSLLLCTLPKLKCFYPGIHSKRLPMLKVLRACHCDRVKILGTECALNMPVDMNEDSQLDSPIQIPLFLIEKVGPKLEEVDLNNDEIAMICNSKFSRGLLQKIKVICYNDRSAIFPINFLARFSNLEKLEVTHCKFEELFSYEGGVGKQETRIVLPIRNLSLNTLPCLKYIWNQEVGQDHLLPNLEALNVVSCGSLVSLGLCSAPFQNLMTLNVQKCETMIKLITPFAVQNLVQLKILRIECCISMTEIVGNEGDDEATFIFEKLKLLELLHLPRLKSFCSGNHAFGFPSLDQVIVSHCPELEIFCKGVLNAPMLQRVQVTNKDDHKGHWGGDLNSTVQKLYTKMVDFEGTNCLVLSDFSKPMQLWKDNLQQGLDFKNLEYLEVCDCNSLTYILTTSTALGLLQLREMKVKNCKMMEQIVRNDGAEEASTNIIVFPSLERIFLESCSNLTSFYLGSSKVECPSLIQITVTDCPKMLAFTSTSPTEQDMETTSSAPFFSDKVAFPNIKHLEIEGPGNWRKIWDDKLFGDSFCEIRTLFVVNCGTLSNIFPFNMMERLDKLERLFIVDCESLEEIIEPNLGANSSESITRFVFPKMRVLVLDKLPKLKCFYSKMHITDWPSLKELWVIECHNVEILAREYVSNPKTFGESQLEISSQQPLFWVKSEVVFPNLEMMTISHLRNMKHFIGFCSEDHCIEFPSLKLLEMNYCSKLKEFMYKSFSGEDHHLSMQPLFNEKVAFPSLETMTLSHLPKMKMVWHNKLAANSFCKLKEMTVKHCNELVTIFPSTILGTFQQLQILGVFNCASLEELYEVQRLNMEETQIVESQLRELYVMHLPKLKQVWSNDPQGIITFQNLCLVRFWDCRALQNVFPASVARALRQLEDLSVAECGVQEIVSKEEARSEMTVTFEFEKVSSLHLWNLPELKCFYPGMHTTKWPVLKVIIVHHCGKVKIFGTEHLSLPDHVKDDGQLQLYCTIPPLLCVEKVIPKFEAFVIN